MKFDESVMEKVRAIPKGKVTTYRSIANSIGTRAYRAVGQAVKRNPNPIKVPCHRVIKSSGEVGGYAGNKKSKKKAILLEKEGIVITKGKIDLEKYGWKP